MASDAGNRLSPGVRLRGLAARAGPDLVEPARRLLAQSDLRGSEAPGQLLRGTRADDRGRDRRLMQQPSQRGVGRRLTELTTQLLVGLQLRSELLEPLLHPIIGTAPVAGLLQRTPEQAAAQRAVRDKSQTEVPQRGDDLQLDGAGGEVVDALL
jgi:hypothetical protein